MRSSPGPSPLRVTFQVHLTQTRPPRRPRRRRATRPLPRLRYALVLGHQVEQGLQAGEFQTHADAAAMIHRTIARVGQLTALTRLAPRIQHDLLHLPVEVLHRIPERLVRPIVAALDWEEQRKLWADVLASVGADSDSAAD